MNLFSRLRGRMANGQILNVFMGNNHHELMAFNLNSARIAAVLHHPRLINTSAICLQSPISGATKAVLNSRVINKNMTLKYASPATKLATRAISEAAQSNGFDEKAIAETDQKQRPLVVMLAWLMAGERNFEKYRQIYLKRGFDVLTVRTSPLEFMFPEKGSQQVAKSMIKFLREAASEYPKTVVHVFSIGAYQFSEVLAQVRLNPALLEPLRNQIRGLICDSSVDLQGAPYGLAKSLAPKNRAAQKLIESSLKAYMQMMHDVATKHYEFAQESFFDNPLETPTLMLLSERDPIATPKTNQMAIEAWKKQGIPVTVNWWSDTDHIAHYRKHPKEYESLINVFLKSINIDR